jgi:hypothetical protein
MMAYNKVKNRSQQWKYTKIYYPDYLRSEMVEVIPKTGFKPATSTLARVVFYPSQ